MAVCVCVCVWYISISSRRPISVHFCAFVIVSLLLCIAAVHLQSFVFRPNLTLPHVKHQLQFLPRPWHPPFYLCSINWMDWDVSSKGNHHPFFLSVWIPVFRRPSTILYSQQLHMPIPMSLHAFPPSRFWAVPTSWGEDLLYEICIKC